MKRLLIITVVLVLSAGVASAQGGGAIGIYADQAGNNCFLPDNVAGLCTYWIVHQLTPGATAAQFSAPQPECLLSVYLSDTALFPVTIGGSQTGVAIGYGACLPSPVAILGVNYFCQGLTGPCCAYPVLPDPAVPSGTIEVVDCINNLITGVSAGTGMVNGNTTDCPCDPTIATEESTWGQIKALYSE